MHLLSLSNWLMGLTNPNRGSISGSEEEGGFFWDRPLFKKYGLLLAKNKNKWALRWIGFCIGAVGCPCFVLEGLNTRGSPLETLSSSPAYCPFERKKETPPSYGYSSVTFFNLASTKLEDAVLDADTHTGRVARQSEVSNNRPTIYLLDCEGSQASQHLH